MANAKAIQIMNLIKTSKILKNNRINFTGFIQ
jgi:hypothetical protein